MGPIDDDDEPPRDPPARTPKLDRNENQWTLAELKELHRKFGDPAEAKRLAARVAKLTEK